MNPITSPAANADIALQMAEMLANPAFWVILVLYAVVHAIVAATVAHFRKK